MKTLRIKAIHHGSTCLGPSPTKDKDR